jgi:hypothetical protein
MVRQDPRHFAKEAARRERRAWIYLSLSAVVIIAVVFGFLWWTW